MKKILAIAVASVMALSGCGSLAYSTPTPTPEPEPTVTNNAAAADRAWEKEMEELSKDIEERERDPDAYWAKRRIEIWGYDPGPGGINDGSGSRSGRCVYDPTMNWDWHDDMVCDGVRVYLLPNDEHVTRDEIEWAAREWAASH